MALTVYQQKLLKDIEDIEKDIEEFKKKRKV